MTNIVSLSLNDLSTRALGRRVEHVRDDPSIPLCVKLEGALLRTGTTAEVALALLRRRPYLIFAMVVWALAGRTEFHERLARHAALDPALLPYRRPLIAFLRREAASGRSVFLVTEAEPAVAQAIADHLGLFCEIVAVERGGSSYGEAVAQRLCDRFGIGDFDYAGNGRGDIPVWRTARRSVIVAPSPGLLKDGIWNSQVADILCPDDRGSGRFVNALHPGRWIKNLLIFLPLLNATIRADLHYVAKAYLVFFAYCLVASAGYVANDLIDLAADRRHLSKRRRMLASGRLPLGHGALLASGLAAAGLAMSFFLSPLLGGWMAVYLFLSLAYSLWIKRTLILDTFVLTALSLHRILTGMMVAGLAPSFWPILFAGFFFLGLAMLSRFGELKSARLSRSRLATRASAYRAGDLEILASIGLASGFLSVLILAIFAGSADAHGLFRSPNLLWGLCPLLLYWVSRVWVCASRGRVPGDPLRFALTDPLSGGIALGIAAVTGAAMFLTIPTYTFV